MQAIEENPQKARSKDNREVRIEMPREETDVESDSDTGKRGSPPIFLNLSEISLIPFVV